MQGAGFVWSQWHFAARAVTQVRCGQLPHTDLIEIHRKCLVFKPKCHRRKQHRELGWGVFAKHGVCVCVCLCFLLVFISSEAFQWFRVQVWCNSLPQVSTWAPKFKSAYSWSTHAASVFSLLPWTTVPVVTKSAVAVCQLCYPQKLYVTSAHQLREQRACVCVCVCVCLCWGVGGYRTCDSVTFSEDRHRDSPLFLCGTQWNTRRKTTLIKIQTTGKDHFFCFLFSNKALPIYVQANRSPKTTLSLRPLFDDFGLVFHWWFISC